MMGWRGFSTTLTLVPLGPAVVLTTSLCLLASSDPGVDGTINVVVAPWALNQVDLCRYPRSSPTIPWLADDIILDKYNVCYTSINEYA